ncbi:hypothetical protein N9R81_04220 [Flavobacteriales bacterium]|nr:hypothetical protein [Flavobacteriales bacterium]
MIGKNILILISIAFSVSAFSQKEITIKGTLWFNQLEPLGGATITLYDSISTAIQTITTPDNGEYKIKIDKNTSYRLVFENKKQVTKRVDINTDVVPCEDKTKSWNYKFVLSLFDSIPNQDYSLYETTPVTTIFCNPESCKFGYGDNIPDPIPDTKPKEAEIEKVEPELPEPTSIPIEPEVVEVAPPQKLDFMVQIGAYSFPENFKYDRLNSLGKIIELKLEDGITRFAVGLFDNINDAEKLKNKAISAGIEDAFIIIIENGERKFLDDFPDLKPAP